MAERPLMGIVVPAPGVGFDDAMKKSAPRPRAYPPKPLRNEPINVKVTVTDTVRVESLDDASRIITCPECRQGQSVKPGAWTYCEGCGPVSPTGHFIDG